MGLVGCMFVVFQKRLLEEFVDGESVVVGFVGESLISSNRWMNTVVYLVGAGFFSKELV